MNKCAKCEREYIGYGYPFFFTHPTEGRSLAFVCASCRYEIRLERSKSPYLSPTIQKRVAVPDAFYKAFEEQV